ncbi:MAG: hypothetical protein ABI615_09860 [Chthoniobacterales bacterium]
MKQKLKFAFVWLSLIALVASLLLSLIPYPIERAIIDQSAPHLDSDYVTVHGMPEIIYISGKGFAPNMIKSFIFNWSGIAFWLFALAILFEVTRLAARVAATGISKCRARGWSEWLHSFQGR